MLASRYGGLLFLLFQLLNPLLLTAQDRIRISEERTRLDSNANGAVLKLAVENDVAHDLPVHLELQTVDTSDRVIEVQSRDLILSHGSRELSIPLTKWAETHTEWMRVKYRVTPREAGSNVAEAQGVMSISEISPQPFVLRLGLPSTAEKGARCRIHVFTQHPGSGLPVGNVSITAALTVEDDAGEHTLKAYSRSNSAGYAALDFDLPAAFEGHRAEIEVQAQSGRFTRDASENLNFIDRSETVVTTDKPIYQPGQHLRVRVLAFDSAHKARPRKKVTVSIHDPENVSLQRTDLQTSLFGEADMDWVIPDNARLGDYWIQVDSGDERPLFQRVKISRYDLPAFTITTRLDRSYYLPGQPAYVEVKADYLFGRPVNQGHVRVVRETSREWNYRDQKWETDEERSIQGEFDSDGKFQAVLDLDDEQDGLSDRSYQRYSDLRYAVYVTDSTTNRTEERRFDVRITREPIHIYVGGDVRRQPKSLPLEFYVSAFYADGTPVKSRVSIHEAESGALLSSISTNKYGVGKVTGLRSGARQLTFTADDGKGAHGAYTESVSRDDSGIRVYPNKILYRQGEPIEVEIRSTFASGPVLLEVSTEEKAIQSRLLQLRNGRLFTVIPYDAEFKDAVTIAARYIGDWREDGVGGARTVAYPRDRELKIDTRFDKSSYMPGDEASVAVRIRTAEGLPQSSLVGLVVVDKAVGERARTDSDFSGASWLCDWCFRRLGRNDSLSGLSRQDLNRLDLNQPVSPDLELAAEILLNGSANRGPNDRLTDDSEGYPQRVFRELIANALKPIKAALDPRLAEGAKHPIHDRSLKELLSSSGVDLDGFRDPWDNPYRFSFSVERGFDVLEIESAGPDKQFGSPDDFTAQRLTWQYFRQRGGALDDAVRAYHQRTRNFIRDFSTLKAELANAGENIDSWMDRWGRPYRFEFEVFRKQLTIAARSSGPNGIFEPSGTVSSDDFSVWTSRIDWTDETQDALLHLVDSYFRATKVFPETPEQFKEVLNSDTTAGTRLLDPWMRVCYPTFRNQYYYANRISVTTYAEYLSTSSQRTSIVPVTGKVQFVVLRSAGPDGIEGNADDFDVAFVSRMATEQSAKAARPEPDANAPVLSGRAGAIQGSVTDAASALIPGVAVVAKSAAHGDFQAISDAEGTYLLRNLPPGFYDVSFSLPGFTERIIQQVPIRSEVATSLNVSLEVGSYAQMVEVRADAVSISTSAAYGLVSRESGVTKLSSAISTPRVRDYFPETLVWQPALQTDRAGKAQLKFKLADNTTTWKLAAVVSTADGQVGMVEKEFVSFQPFFVEHDPPKTLTQGDQIALPVLVRNYLDKDQSIELKMTPADWFESLSDTAKNTRVKPGETAREIFRFKAVKSIRDAAQRVTANGNQAGDAVEKRVTVHPDGEENVHVSAEIFRNFLSHSIVIPSSAIPNTARAEVRIYPNLMAHVVDAIEGIMRRPYGCAEQTISSAYPSLMLLKYFKEHSNESPALSSKARRYLQTGLDHLRAYQNADGSFTYWGQGDGDVAVTAYAVQFLSDASEMVPVDEGTYRRASEWLLRQQGEDGSWKSPSLTALVARVLSRPGLRPGGKRDSLKEALAYLHQQTLQLEEPYALASLAIAAMNAGDVELTNEAVKRLQQTAQREPSGAYWDLQTNTPFYGWGLAGRVETTALAVRALAGAKSAESLVDQGVLFLLRNTDRFGVWHSTQATVNVLDALATVVGESQQSAGATSAEVVVNGRTVASIEVPGSDQPVNPIVVDLSRFLMPTGNAVEIRGGPNGAASVQFVESYYIPWTQSQDSSSPLRLAVTYDKTEAKVGDEIHCRVEAERVGFRGYGMMLAEIGLPPGADVDRASLEAAIKSRNWDVNRYEVLPDRIILYLWPRAGGTRFDFTFRVRYGINAQTPASTVYDYYNPDAHVTVKPARFVIEAN